MQTTTMHILSCFVLLMHVCIMLLTFNQFIRGDRWVWTPIAKSITVVCMNSWETFVQKQTNAYNLK